MLNQVEKTLEMDSRMPINEVALSISNQILLAKKRKKTSFDKGILALGMASAGLLFAMFEGEDCHANDDTSMYGLSVARLNELEAEMKKNAIQNKNFLS